jgi:hypothetical protein
LFLFFDPNFVMKSTNIVSSLKTFGNILIKPGYLCNVNLGRNSPKSYII